MENSAKFLGLKENRQTYSCELFHYFKALGYAFTYLTLIGNCWRNIIVSISQQRESRLREVMEPAQSHKVNKWWHQTQTGCSGSWYHTLFKIFNCLPREASSTAETGTKIPWVLGKQMVFPGLWTLLLPRFKIHPSHHLPSRRKWNEKGPTPTGSFRTSWIKQEHMTT